MQPGLYDDKNNLIQSWEEVEKEHPSISDKINPYAFRGYVKVAKVVMSDTIKFIGKYAFYDCHNLKEVIFSKNLEAIDEGAFRNCGIEKIIFPDSLKTIGRKAFMQCYNLNSIKFPDNLKEIGHESFGNCNALESIILPQNLEEIKPRACCACSRLNNVKFNDKLRVIGYTAFAFTDIQTLSLPDSLVEICDYAFGNNKNLEEIKFGKGKLFIGPNAFESSERLTSVKLPENIEKLGYDIFHDCPSLKEIIVTKENMKMFGYILETYKDIIKIEKDLDALLDKGASFKEINDAFKNNVLEK